MSIFTTNRVQIKQTLSASTLEDKCAILNKNSVEATHLMTNTMYAYIYIAGEVELQADKVLKLYKDNKRQRENHAIKTLPKLIQGMNIDCRMIERAKLKNFIGCSLKTFLPQYNGYGNLTSRLQYYLRPEMEAYSRTIRMCTYNHVSNENKHEGDDDYIKEVFVLLALSCNGLKVYRALRKNLDKIYAKLIDLDPCFTKIARKMITIDSTIETLHEKFKSISHEVDFILNCYLTAEPVQGYWWKKTTDAQDSYLMHIASEQSGNIIYDQLMGIIMDYTKWWIAKTVKETRLSGTVPVSSKEDIKRCVKDNLLAGRAILRIKQLAQRCQEEDVDDLTDEIFQYEYKDIISMIISAVSPGFTKDVKDKILQEI